MQSRFGRIKFAMMATINLWLQWISAEDLVKRGCRLIEVVHFVTHRLLILSFCDRFRMGFHYCALQIKKLMTLFANILDFCTLPTYASFGLDQLASPG